ncbi:MAG: hypothetical protein MUP09_02340 [Thiovulaceae bacterium]|nr:hypothetical protein [Sulfurimonadaceae bacterium]
MTRFIDREQLYKQVWSEPLTKLAPRYKLTPYALKKLCDRFVIPLPTVGHWSKIAYAKAVDIPSLPVYECHRLQVCKSTKKEMLAITIPVRSVSPEIKITVKTTLSNPHPLIAKTRDILKNIEIDDYGMKKILRNGIDFRTSKTNETRALHIMDSLFKWFEKNGAKIICPYEKGVRTYAVIGEERIEIAIEEKSIYIGMVDKMWWGYKRHMRGYEPTGVLSLVIRTYCWGCGLRKTWSDGKTGKLEDKLDEFIEGVYAIAAYEKERVYKQKIDDEKRARTRKEKEYIQKCEELEIKMLNDLKAQAKQLNMSRDISEYIVEVEKEATAKFEGGPYPKELLDWFSWAREHAGQLHPLRSGLPNYKKATEILQVEDMN